MPEPQQCEIWATSATYNTAHRNAGSLTHWARPGIKPAISWFLVGFVNHWATTGTLFRDLKDKITFALLQNRCFLEIKSVQWLLNSYLSQTLFWVFCMYWLNPSLQQPLWGRSHCYFHVTGGQAETQQYWATVHGCLVRNWNWQNETLNLLSLVLEPIYPWSIHLISCTTKITSSEHQEFPGTVSSALAQQALITPLW